MICAARWYADTAAEGMPLADAPSTTALAVPRGTPGAMTPARGTLAGASIAWLGTSVPSGSLRLSVSVPVPAAVAEPKPARLNVHAPESSASGTIMIAFCLRDSCLRAVLCAMW